MSKVKYINTAGDLINLILDHNPDAEDFDINICTYDGDIPLSSTEIEIDRDKRKITIHTNC